MAKSCVTSVDKGMNAIVANLKKLASKKVFVGVQSKERPHRRKRKGEPASEDNSNPMNLAQIAAIHEFGLGKMPQRSFLRSAMDENKDKLAQMSAQVVKNVTKGADPVQQMNTVGMVAQGMVQKKIVTGPFTPNSPATIKAKGSSRPLIDTGHLRQSITFLVDDKDAHNT